MRDSSFLLRKLDARNIDRSLYQLVKDAAVLEEAWKRHPFEAHTTVNIADVSGEKLTATIRAHVIEDDVYFVLWDYDGNGIRMSGAALASQINDLWRPASDDVVVLDGSMRPIMLIHHEEYLLIA